MSSAAISRVPCGAWISSRPSCSEADVVDRGDDVGDGQRLLVERLEQAELLVDLVAADLGQVVALRVEVVVLQQRQRGLARRRLARAQLAVDVEQRVVGTDGVVLLLGEPDRLELAELGHDGLVVVLLADVLGDGHQGLEQDGDVLLALAVEADADHVALVDLELQPGTAARDELGGVDVLVGRLVGGALEVDARRADQLGDDDALGAVDDEGAAVGHEREVAHEDRLALDLTGVVVGELRRDVERSGVGEVLLLALVDGVLGVVEDRVLEGERHRLAEVLDRGDLLEDLLQTGLARDVLALAATALDRASQPRCRSASRSCRSGGRGAAGPREALGSSRTRCDGRCPWKKSCGCYRGCCARPRRVLMRNSL